MAHKHDKKRRSKSWLYGATALAGLTVLAGAGGQIAQASTTSPVTATIAETLNAMTLPSATVSQSTAASAASSAALVLSAAQSTASSVSSVLSADQINVSSAASAVTSATAAVTSYSAALSSATAAATSNNTSVSSLTAQLNALSIISSSNLSSDFPSTTFTSATTVILPEPSSAFTPDVTEINSYFLIYINELRSLNGQPAVSYSSTQQSIAQTRASEIVSDFSHDRAGTQTEDISANGGIVDRMQSNQEIAYYLLMDWADESDNPEALGSGHYGHLANLLYGGPVAGLGFVQLATPYPSGSTANMDVFAAWEAPQYSDWTLYNAAVAMANSMTRPNYVPLPNITFDYVNASSFNSLTAAISAVSSSLTAATSAGSSATAALAAAQTVLLSANTASLVASAALANTEIFLSSATTAVTAATTAYNSAVAALNPSTTSSSAKLYTTNGAMYNTQNAIGVIQEMIMYGTNADGSTMTAAQMKTVKISVLSGPSQTNLSLAGSYVLQFAYTDPTTGAVITATASLLVIADQTGIKSA
jgi:hypothetical protein